MEADLRARIVAEARKHIGMSWEHQQRRAGAVDCAGLAVVVGQALDFPLLDVSSYSRTPDGSLLSLLDKQARRVPITLMGPGNLVVMDFGAGPSHLGILADYLYGGLSIIHSDNRPGVRRVVEHRLAHLRDKIVAAYEPSEAASS